MSETITITVSGKPRIGKSTIAEHIYNTLARTGFDVEIECIDGDQEIIENSIIQRTIAVIDNRTKILIKQTS